MLLMTTKAQCGKQTTGAIFLYAGGMAFITNFLKRIINIIYEFMN